MSSQYTWPRRKTIPRVKEARLSNSYSTINGDSGQVQADPESTINITGSGGISTTATEGSPDSLVIDGDGMKLEMITYMENYVVFSKVGGIVITETGEIVLNA